MARDGENASIQELPTFCAVESRDAEKLALATNGKEVNMSDENLPTILSDPKPSVRAGRRPKRPPVSTNCPNCDSTEFKTLPKSSRIIAFAPDRVCVSCSTRYVPATPVWGALVFLVGGLLISPILAAGIFLFFGSIGGLINGNVPPAGTIIAILGCVIGGLFTVVGCWGFYAVFHAIRVLIFRGKY